MPDMFLFCRNFLDVFSFMLFLLFFVFFFLFPARENGVAQHACFCTLEPELFSRRDFSKLFLNSKKMSFGKFPSLEERRCATGGFSYYVFFALKLAGIRRRVCVWPSKLGAFIQSKGEVLPQKITRGGVSLTSWLVRHHPRSNFWRVGFM